MLQLNGQLRPRAQSWFYPQQGQQRNPNDVSKLKPASTCLSTGTSGPLPRGPLRWIQRDAPMAEGLTINPASHRQVPKPALRKSRRSEQFSWRENRKASGWTRWRVSPARKPFAIAQEFGNAKIQDPDRCEISRLAARPGQETGAGCGLAPSRTSTGRFLRRARSLTHESTFQAAVDRRDAAVGIASAMEASLTCRRSRWRRGRRHGIASAVGSSPGRRGRSWRGRGDRRRGGNAGGWNCRSRSRHCRCGVGRRRPTNRSGRQSRRWRGGSQHRVSDVGRTRRRHRGGRRGRGRRSRRRRRRGCRRSQRRQGHKLNGRFLKDGDQQGVAFAVEANVGR